MTRRNGFPVLVMFCPVHGLPVQVGNHGGLVTKCSGCMTEVGKALARIVGRC